MIKLEQCCCGCKLKTGTIIFLSLKASFAVYQLYLVLFEIKTNHLSQVDPTRFHFIAYTFICNFIMIIACCTGIRVITKSRAKFLVPFICCQIVLFICYLAFFLWFWYYESLYFHELLDEVSKLIFDETTKATIDAFLKHQPYIYIVAILAFIGSNIYFTMVVYNYCVKLRNESSCSLAVSYTRAAPEETELVGF